jgi:hypothetical protein
MVFYAIQVSIWRRLNRVVVEHPGGVIARWTIPDLVAINAIAAECAEQGLKPTGLSGCLEKWVRR